MNETIISSTTLLPSDSTTYSYQTRELNLFYVICEIVVAIFAVAGNALVIFVFQRERRLRRRTNYYIVSLATADFLVGFLGIPFAIMSSVGLPNNLHACLFTVSLLVVLCTISIFCLVAVSVDRYWAILHPMGYSTNVRTKTALVIISICWFAGLLVGFLPLMGWHQNRPKTVDCFFLTVMDYNYLVFLYFGTIITPALVLAAFYAHIYRVVLKQLRQIVVMNPQRGTTKKNINLSSGGMIRLLGVQQRNEVKATQNLAIIVLFFMICWIPLYTINCIIAFHKDFQVNSTFMLACIILSHVNSAGNPLLYAYHLRDFRAALKNFFCNLFYAQHEYCDHFPPRYNSNYSHCKMQYRNSSSNLDYQKQLIIQTKVGTVVKNSALLAAAPAGKIDRIIWNIAEDSGRDSGSSHDSLNKDKELIIKQVSPPSGHELNDAYIDSSSIDDESDDIFMDDYLPYYKETEETCLSDVVKSSRNLSNLNLSSDESFPDMLKTVFTIESQNSSHVQVNEPPQHCHKLTPYKIVRNMFNNRKRLKRSLSDGGSRSDSLKNLNEAVVADYYSVPM